MKYDKTSVEFRKEYERLSKKSKGEYESLGKNDKTELFLREGLPTQKSTLKVKQFGATEGTQYSNTNTDKKAQEDNLVNDSKGRSKSGGPQVSGRRKKEARLKKTDDLKTKPRLHEQGVISIRPDNPDLKVVMQGTKIQKRCEKKGDNQAEDVKVIIHL
jgi:hypothetical protein